MKYLGYIIFFITLCLIDIVGILAVNGVIYDFKKYEFDPISIA